MKTIKRMAIVIAVFASFALLACDVSTDAGADAQPCVERSNDESRMGVGGRTCDR